MSGYNICDDLIAEIFVRVPPKSVIRFRTLSKYWHSRLVSPQFLHDHRLQCSKNPPKVLIRHWIYRNHDHRDIYTLHSQDQLPFDRDSSFIGIPGVEFPYQESEWTASVIGSSNGILCLCVKGNEVISLWNISIRRKLIVPRRPPSETNFYNVLFGFGFDPITDDYNIVAICYNKYTLQENRTLIYSLKTDSWGAIPSPPNRLYDTFVSPDACFFNGILHWNGHGYSTSTRPSLTRFILTFNLSSRVFGYIWLPESWKIEQVTTINGCLAVVSPEYNVWEDDYSLIRVMKEYGNTNSWSKLFKVRISEYIGMTVFQPIMNGDILAYNVFNKESGVYNTRTNFAKVLEFEPGFRIIAMDPYVESLELFDKERATTCG